MSSKSQDSQMGSQAGAAVGSIYGPVGSALGGLAGGAIGGMFGNNDNPAQDTLLNALKQIQGIHVPTVQEMTLSNIQKYVDAGILTPQQAQAVLQQGNAFDNTTAHDSGMDSELGALGKYQDIVNQGGNDAQEKADLNNVLGQLNTQQRGQRGAILQDAAQRGSLTSGMTMAAQLAANQDDAGAANSNALNANAAAQNRVLQALSSMGSLGGQVQQQNYQQTANKANAANAINQFNAQQQNALNQFNAQQANAGQQFNITNAQNTSDNNVKTANDTAKYNAGLAQQSFQDALQKGVAGSGGSVSLAGQQNTDNQNNSNAFGKTVSGVTNSIANAAQNGGLNSIKNYFSSPGTGLPAGADVSSANYQTNSAANSPYETWTGMSKGGVVPGHAPVPGNSPANDVVPTKLSPGEVVLPRTVAQDPNSVMSFLHRMKKDAKPAPHPRDVASVMQALGHLREGH